MIADDLRLCRFRKEDDTTCFLAMDPIQRCRYYEECIIPMDRSALKPNPRRQWDEGIHAYKLATGCLKPKRLCPQCRKHGLEPGKRLCLSCATDQGKAAKRKWWSEHRTAEVSTKPQN